MKIHIVADKQADKERLELILNYYLVKLADTIQSIDMTLQYTPDKNGDPFYQIELRAGLNNGGELNLEATQKDIITTCNRVLTRLTHHTLSHQNPNKMGVLT